jgi:cholesterol oxidase
VGVFFGEPGKEVTDPYFGGEGPARSGCIQCGSCMVGCRYNAKNTLVKNYLWFAERLGAEVIPERLVADVRPLGADDGSEGYEVASERPGAWVRRERRTHTARGVVLAAGALGTNSLLAACKLSGSLPRVSDRLGELVRTNSESILAVTSPDDSRDFARSIAITSSIYPDPDTHIEVVTYGRAGDAMSFLFTMLTGRGTKLTRPLLWMGQALRHPIRLARTLWPFRWSRRTVILLVMQTLDNAIRLRRRRRVLGRGARLQTEQDPERPIPTFIPVANEAAERIASRIGGLPQGGTTESVFNIPTTAHILGGAAIGRDAGAGVVDSSNRVFGYQNLLVCDGSAVPANPGVNPSLTITALAERAMSLVPENPAAASGDGQPRAALSPPPRRTAAPPPAS